MEYQDNKARIILVMIVKKIKLKVLLKIEGIIMQIIVKIV